MHGLDLLEAAGIGWDIFELDSYEERGFGDMNHGIALLRPCDHLVAGPCEQLTAPLWPGEETAAGHLPRVLPTIGGGQRDQGQREDDKHLNRLVGFLRRRPQVSLLLTRYQAAVLGQTAVITVVEEPRGLVDRDLGSVQEGGAPLYQGPLIHPVHPSYCLFAVQVSRHSGIDATGDRPTQALCQALGELILRLSPGPPPSSACIPDLEAGGLQFKTSGFCSILSVSYLMRNRRRQSGSLANHRLYRPAERSYTRGDRDDTIRQNVLRADASCSDCGVSESSG